MQRIQKNRVKNPAFLKILQKIISFDLLKTFLAIIELVPDDDFSFFEGLLDIDDPLVRRATKLQHEVAFAFIIAAIDQDINQRQELQFIRRF